MEPYFGVNSKESHNCDDSKDRYIDQQASSCKVASNDLNWQI